MQASHDALAQLVTKEDLLATKADLLQELRLLEQRLTIRLGTIVAVGVGAIAAHKMRTPGRVFEQHRPIGGAIRRRAS